MKNLFLLFFLLLSACAPKIETLPLKGIGPFTVNPLVRTSNFGPMDVSADGRLVAWGGSQLTLYEVDTGRHRQLLKAATDALSWSPDGALLAAAVVSPDGESHLYVFDRNAVSVYEQPLSGRVGRLLWRSEGNLTAGVIKHKTYSFGTHMTGELLQWDKHWQLTKTLLYETTITSATAFLLADRLGETLEYDISAFGDEILYARLFAPPAFAAERYLVLKNLQTSDETRITSLPLLAGEGRLVYDGESVLVDTGSGVVLRRELWSPKVLQSWSGSLVDYDVSSDLLFAGHQLFKDRELLLELPLQSQAKLSAGGQFLLVEWQHQLYLLTGYPVTQVETLSEIKRQKIKKLRRLRSRGLIEQNEYQQSRERLLQ